MRGFSFLVFCAEYEVRVKNKLKFCCPIKNKMLSLRYKIIETMSLDVTLSNKKWSSYDEGKTWKEENEEVYCANITHNLGDMADAAGIYEALWRPYKLKENYNIAEDDYQAEYKFESENPTKAKEIIPLLEKGLKKLKRSPTKYEKYNSENGWGLYKHFVPFVEKYLTACKKYPEAFVETDR